MGCHHVGDNLHHAGVRASRGEPAVSGADDGGEATVALSHLAEGTDEVWRASPTTAEDRAAWPVGVTAVEATPAAVLTTVLSGQYAFAAAFVA